MTEDRGSNTAVPTGRAVADEDVAHCVLTDVGEIDEHAEAIHFFDEVASGGAEAVPVGFRNHGTPVFCCLDGGVGVLVVAVPSQGCVADAELVVEAEGGD